MGESLVGADDVEHIASLARVSLEDSQVERFQADFEDILEYFERLEDVPSVERDVAEVDELRADHPSASLSQAEALENAASTEDGYFKGPPVG